MEQNTIAAISTAPGRAGLAVVRVSGPDAERIAEMLGFPDLPDRAAVFGRLRHPEDGRQLDRVVVTRFAAPASYTGQTVLEISCHGGALVPALVLDAVCAAGARPAEPGEFARRAFLNGKLDLIQVEATLDLIDARSEASHATALFQLDGGLSARISELRERLLGLQAMLSYEIDFPEEDDGPIADEDIRRTAQELSTELDELLLHAPDGELVREGALTVIAGKPNSGKSSLFNSLLGKTRAIVTEIPGTTRDAIEAVISISGYPFRLVDTAGLRDDADYVEGMGIEVARRYLEHADLVVFCVEADRSLESEEVEFLAAQRERRAVVQVRTKSDLPAGSVLWSPVGDGYATAHQTTPRSSGQIGATGSGTVPRCSRRRAPSRDRIDLPAGCNGSPGGAHRRSRDRGCAGSGVLELLYRQIADGAAGLMARRWQLELRPRADSAGRCMSYGPSRSWI
jgi:tRNA modification GTPase